MISFAPGPHEYLDDGIIIPSVTQILKKAGVIDDRWYDAESRERGSAVHELCERYAEGYRIDGVARPLDSLEYVNAFAAWYEDRKPYAMMTECTIGGMVNGRRYAGRFDMLAIIDGKRWLIDYKTGGSAKWHAAQIAAYSMGRISGDGDTINPDRCAILYLRADGKYRFDTIGGARLLDGIRQFKDTA